MIGKSANRVRRVLMTADTVGGVWTYALELARALRLSGVEAIIAAMGGPLTDRQRKDARRYGSPEIHESSWRLEWMEEPWVDVEAAGVWLLDLEQLLRPDIIHLNGFAHGALHWKAPVLMVGHSCVYSWYEAVKGQKPPSAWERYRREISGGLRAADLVTAPSGVMLDSLRRMYGEFNAAAPVYNGRRAENFPPGEKESIIMASGRLWDEAKNVGILEKIGGHISWPICLAGEKNHPDGGEFSPEGVEYLGNLSWKELAAWLGKASVFVSPARYEPFGYGPLEAALAGCALVLGDIPSLREIWGKSALYVPPERFDIIRAVLQRLITDETLLRHMGKNARARALEFTPERMGKEYLKLYEQLATNRNLRLNSVPDSVPA